MLALPVCVVQAAGADPGVAKIETGRVALTPTGRYDLFPFILEQAVPYHRASPPWRFRLGRLHPISNSYTN